jgi:hypothetical protein
MTDINNNQSTAAQYRAIRGQHQQPEEHFTRVSPSGMTWILRRVPLMEHLFNGQLPLSIAAKMAAAKAGTKMDDTEAFASLSFEEQAKSIELTTSRIRYCCVSPRIVDVPVAGDEIAPNEILPEDFPFLIHWINGGDQADGLEHFRAPGRTNGVARADGAKVRRPSKRTPKR